MATRKPDYPTLLLLGSMYALLGGNVALYVFHREPWFVHLAISTVAVHLAFTVWHDAAHGIVSKKAWVNDFVGWLGMVPYMTPYFMQRFVHMEHHHKLNELDDPNYIYTDGSLLTLPFRYPRALAYGKKVLKSDPRSSGERLSDLLTTLAIGAVYIVAAATGHLLDALLLWFVPVVIAKFFMDFYINFLPHRGLPADRFRGTRVVEVAWFTPIVLGHNYHAVHHLWPTVPWHQYRAVYRRKLDYLKQNGVPIERTVFGTWTESSRRKRENAHAS